MPIDKKAHTFAELLTSKQKANLKASAHQLKPIIQVGLQGFSEALIKELHLALEKQELIKIQLAVNLDANSKKTKQDELTKLLPKNCHFVGRIGRNVILYFEKDPLKAKITLKKLIGVKNDVIF